MKTDILIVGGGLAGLALADRLHRGGVDFHLIEAREKTGGRILSHHVDHTAFDLGPAWIWPGQPRIAQLLHRFGLETFEQAHEGDMLSEDANGQVRRISGQAMMKGSWRVAGGLAQLTDHLCQSLPQDSVSLGIRLRHLAQGDSDIRADVVRDGQPGAISAQRVILSLPPRVSTANVTFDPDLPQAAHAALAQIPTWMAAQAKIMAVFDRPVWREAGLSGDALSQKGPMVEIHDASGHAGGASALFGFVGFPAHIRRQHRAEILEMARDQILRLFGGAAVPTQIVMQDWADSPETSTPADETAPAGHPAYGRPAALSELWGGRIILGSTEMAGQFGGYLEGALEAADEVARLLSTDRAS